MLCKAAVIMLTNEKYIYLLPKLFINIVRLAFPVCSYRQKSLFFVDCHIPTFFMG